jgi:Putative prokaryotic signal transducing protein
MPHILLDKRQEWREARSRIAHAGKLDDDSQGTSPVAQLLPRGSSRPRTIRRSGFKVKALGWKGMKGMEELLRSNDAVLISFVSALLSEEDIDFIVADANMSVLEGSIGALPRRVLVESAVIGRARAILNGAGIGHVIANDGNN